MAKKSDARKAKAFCEPLAEDLAALADILISRGICTDISPLTAAVCQMGDFGQQIWKYEVNGLLFPLRPADNPSLPARLFDLSCRLNLRVSGSIPADPNSALGDPFTSLSVDIIIRGRTRSNKPTAVAWHFDRHIGAVAAAAAAHPVYHWQCGGNQAREFAQEVGSGDLLPVLLIDSPRIAHPPLDGVLAVDFILSNFVASEWRPMRELPKYREILVRSQKQFWRPYAAGVRRWFANSIPSNADTDSAWASEDLWPNLINPN
jgi:hypothetical protein